VLQPARPPFFLASGGLVGLGCEGNGWFSARLCRLGPFRCRVSCPGGACKVEAARLLWNKVLQALLHLVVSCSGGGGGPVGLVGGGSEDLVGASVRGGPCTGVFRRPVMAAASSASGLLRFWQAAEVRGSWVQDVEKAAGLVEARRLDRARLPRGGGRCRRRSACIQGRRSLGRGPDRWAFSGSFCSSARTGVYFVCEDGRLLRSTSKPACDEASFGLKMGGDGRSRCSSATTTTTSGVFCLCWV